MIPSNKFDEKALIELSNASDKKVLENAIELLEWLQDINWPVFNGIVERLSTIGEELKEPIYKILAGNDSTWKANIVGHLIPKFTPLAQKIYTEELKTLLLNPSNTDFEEGLVDFLEIQLGKNEPTT